MTRKRAATYPRAAGRATRCGSAAAFPSGRRAWCRGWRLLSVGGRYRSWPLRLGGAEYYGRSGRGGGPNSF